MVSPLFAMNNLPVELVGLILEHATIPEFGSCINRRQVITLNSPAYFTARSCALVSFAWRYFTMPNLLHTVLLPCPSNIHAFIQSLEDQKGLTGRLQIDYACHVKNIWIGEDYDPYVGPIGVHYPSLYQLLRNAQMHSFGVHNLGMVSLWPGFDALLSGTERWLSGWTCSNVTFSGDLWRWNSWKQSTNAQGFLQGIQTLVLDFPCGDPGANETYNSRQVIPTWVDEIPWYFLTSLARITFPLAIGRKRITYHGTAECVKSWVDSDNPLEFGNIVDDVSQPYIHAPSREANASLSYGLSFVLSL